jgi:hypothetical protein
MPEKLPENAETTIIDLLTITSGVFGEQCVTTITGCACQSRFLKNLVTQYWSSKSGKTTAENQHASHPKSAPNYRIQHESNDPSDPRIHTNSTHDSLTTGFSNLLSEVSSPSPPQYRGQEKPANRNTTETSNFCQSEVSAGNSSLLPFAEVTRDPDLSTQPLWFSNVMEPEVWEGLLADSSFYPVEPYY